MKTTTPDPSLELACRIYAYRADGESWTSAVDGFARAVLMRHPRTVHRWLAGESPIPKAVAAWIMDGLPPTQATTGFLTNIYGTGIADGGSGEPDECGVCVANASLGQRCECGP